MWSNFKDIEESEILSYKENVLYLYVNFLEQNQRKV